MIALMKPIRRLQLPIPTSPYNGSKKPADSSLPARVFRHFQHSINPHQPDDNPTGTEPIIPNPHPMAPSTLPLLRPQIPKLPFIRGETQRLRSTRTLRHHRSRKTAQKIGKPSLTRPPRAVRANTRFQRERIGG